MSHHLPWQYLRLRPSFKFQLDPDHDVDPATADANMSESASEAGVATHVTLEPTNATVSYRDFDLNVPLANTELVPTPRSCTGTLDGLLQIRRRLCRTNPSPASRERACRSQGSRAATDHESMFYHSRGNALDLLQTERLLFRRRHQQIYARAVWLAPRDDPVPLATSQQLYCPLTPRWSHPISHQLRFKASFWWAGVAGQVSASSARRRRFRLGWVHISTCH